MAKNLGIVLLLAVGQTIIGPVVGELPECKDNEYHYEFTECGSDDGRWHVPVPHDPNHCVITVKPSIRQKSCDSSCPDGQYLDVSTLKEGCKSCAKGTYSLGGAVHYNNWTILPSEFDTYSIKDYSGTIQDASDSGCNSTWLADGWYLRTHGISCITRLTYSTTIVRNEGSLSFTYYFSNNDGSMYFDVFVQNEQCHITGQNNENDTERDDGNNDNLDEYDENNSGYKYPSSSSNSEWKNYTMKLKRGKNLVVWEVQHWYSHGSASENTVYIKDIEVKGVSFSSECAQCQAGSYADEEGSKWCKWCPENFISGPGSEKCSPCNEKTEYAPRGSPKCLKRDPCKITDYFETSSPCDKDNKYQTLYKWIEPRKCSYEVKGAMKLPSPGAKQNCPPCNPGMNLNVTQCIFCPPKTFSNGHDPCKKCPASTAPVLSHDFRWWKDLPPSIQIWCYSKTSCATAQGWLLRGEYLGSGLGHADDVRLTFQIITKGFAGEGGLVSRTASSRGMVKIDFELDCDGPCYFSMYEKNHVGERTTKVQDWEGRHARQNYSYIVTSKESRGFFFRFQKTENVYYSYEKSFAYTNDRLKVYSVVLTNTLDGGAEECRECPVGVHDSESGCIECANGHFINMTSKKCIACEKGTYLSNNTCVKCGPGLTSSKGSSKCYSSCHYYYKDGRHLSFVQLKGIHSVQTQKSFLAQGSAFFYEYNINLCGIDAPPASCHSNASYGARRVLITQYLNATICQMRIIPDKKTRRAFSSGIAGIGHQLMGIYEEKPENLSLDIFKDEKLLNESLLYFDYLSHTTTPSCPNGRSAWIILRCDSEASEKGTIKFPPECQEGTCDGCQFLFLWHTKYACPLCSENDYHKIESGCANHKKTTHYRWNNLPKGCVDGVALLASKSIACQDMTVHEAMQHFQILIGIVAFVVTAIIASFVFLWYKNRVLKYKLYHRVAGNDSNQTEELPQVQSCMDDEEDDERVEFRKGGNPGTKLFKKLKDIANKEDDTSKLNESFDVDLS